MHDTKIEMKLEEETKKLGKICEQLQEAIHHEFDKGIEQVDVEEMGKSIDMLKDIYEAKEKLIKGCYYKYILGAMEKEDEEEKEERKMMEKMREQYSSEDEDEERRFYRGQPRSKTSGRYMSRGDGRRSRGYEEPMYYGGMPEIYNPMEYYRDLDRNSMNRMYFSGGNFGSQSGQSTGGSNMNGGNSTRGYEEYQRGYSEGRAEGERNGRQNESRSERARRNYTDAKEMNKGNTPEEKQKKMKELENYTKELAEDVTAMIADASPEERSLLKQKMQVLMQKIQ